MWSTFEQICTPDKQYMHTYVTFDGVVNIVCICLRQWKERPLPNSFQILGCGFHYKTGIFLQFEDTLSNVIGQITNVWTYSFTIIKYLIFK